jgi:hypothetical protein
VFQPITFQPIVFQPIFPAPDAGAKGAEVEQLPEKAANPHSKKRFSFVFTSAANNRRQKREAQAARHRGRRR